MTEALALASPIHKKRNRPPHIRQTFLEDSHAGHFESDRVGTAVAGTSDEDMKGEQEAPVNETRARNAVPGLGDIPVGWRPPRIPVLHQPESALMSASILHRHPSEQGGVEAGYGDGLVLRFVAGEVEDLFRLLRATLGRLEAQTGIKPYGDRC